MEEKTQNCPCSKKSKKVSILKSIVFIILIITTFYIAFITKNTNQNTLKNSPTDSDKYEGLDQNTTEGITIEVR
jgi:hypothetical protein